MNTIFTLGYLHSTPEAIQAYVDQLGALVVDIRFSPYSRDPRWAGTAIRDAVGQDNYVWVVELGNVNYKNGKPIELYKPHLALRILRPLVEARPIILLCACAHYDTCHRKVAAEYLSDAFDVPVEHLEARPATGGLRAISLTQPWATLVAIGAKRIETRSWRTPYRGQLAIHAAKTFPTDARSRCHQEPIKATLMASGIESLADLPLGAVVAVGHLVDCVPTESLTSISRVERAFGDYTPGRFGWLFEGVEPLPEPIPARGALGLWAWAGMPVLEKE